MRAAQRASLSSPGFEWNLTRPLATDVTLINTLVIHKLNAIADLNLQNLHFKGRLLSRLRIGEQLRERRFQQWIVKFVP